MRRHIPDDTGRLCCNDVRYLSVADVDSSGFVTSVRCIACDRIIKTTCRELNWTYEKISKLSQLKAGDHICWHRPKAYWHHAIVTDVGSHTMKIVEYFENSVTVEEREMPEHEACKGWCNTLYRVNYQECYGDKYTVLRARKLVNEDRYNLAERNCEHFSRWCKTGMTSSSQISIAWTSAGKAILAIGLRLLVLVILGLLEYLHESQEDEVRDRAWFELLQKILIVIYIVVMTVVFIAYLLKTTGSHLAAVRPRRDEAKTPWCCRPGTNSCKAIRLMCCSFCTCCSIIRRIICCFCDNVKCCPCTCCRRPAHLSCGLFIRIAFRELSAAAGTLAIMLNEECITNKDWIKHCPPRNRTALLLLFATLAQLGGYLLGAFVGRWMEYCCSSCCECCCDNFCPSVINDYVPI